MGQGDIHFEEGIVRQILGIAKKAFDVWSNTRKATDTISSSYSTSARTHPQTTLLSGSSYQMVPLRAEGRNQSSTGASSAAVGSEAYLMDVSTGSPVQIKPPRRNQPDNSSHSMPPLFIAMPQTPYTSYNSTSLALDEHSGTADLWLSI
jgi:hypothetical protein